MKNQGFALEVKGLTEVFGQLVVVDYGSFLVNQGEFFGFLGPNGAGKTATIRRKEGQVLLWSCSLRVLKESGS